MNDLEHRGHHVHETYLMEGIYQYVIREHSDGRVGGRGAHSSPISARAEIDECVDGRRPESWCSLERSRIAELADDRAQVNWR